MKKTTLLLFGILISFSFSINAQQNNWCGTDHKIQEAISSGLVTPQEIQDRIMRAKQSAHTGSRVGPFTIPVVFHIIHDNGIGNISEAQIQSALDVLNEDYNRLNADSTDWRNTANAPFQPVVADMQITFKLAKKDPNQNCTNGIVRHNAPNLTYNAGDDVKSSASGGSDGWDNDKYLNIWVVNSIAGSGQGTTLGYATIPWLGVTADAGIVVRNDYIGRQGVGTSVSDGRTLTHEAGHFLGLLHTFQGPFFGGGDGCQSGDCGSSGDYVCDTPPAQQATYTCNLNLESCASVIPQNCYYGIDVLDMIENYMSYDDCQNMFTLGQRNVVWSALDTSSIPEYSNMVSAANITFTGVNDPAVLCEVAFSADKHVVCAGGTVNFLDESFNAVSSRTWTFTGGTPSSTSDAQVSVVYPTPGLYTVSLQVSDGSTTLDTTITDMILVLENPGTKDSVWDSFETYSTFPDMDYWFTYSDFSNSFELTTNAAASGNNSLYLNNHGFSGVRTDELISGVYNFSNAPVDSNFYINFKYAYQNRTGNTSSSLNYIKILMSSDCGESWVTRKTIQGNNFGNGNTSGAFVPTAQDWISAELTLPVPAINVDDLRFKFVVSTEDGNNFYIDDINVYISDQSHLSMDINAWSEGIKLYPNPTKGDFSLDLNLRSDEFGTIELLDLSGRKVKDLHSYSKIEKNQQLNFQTSELSAGVYLVKINVKGNTVIKKLILEK